jgi:hypothetical protein
MLRHHRPIDMAACMVSRFAGRLGTVGARYLSTNWKRSLPLRAQSRNLIP